MKRGEGNKRAQVTIFIIVALLIIAAIVVFFLFRGNTNTGNGSPEISPIYTKTLSCLESTTKEGVKYVALQGGYYNIPEELSVYYLAEEVPYYYLDSKTTIPSILKVEDELESYISENLKLCIDFDNLKEQGFEVTEGDLLISVDINDDEINVKADYPLTLKKGEDISRLREFKADIPSNLQREYSTSQEIVNSYYQKPGFVCMTCLDDISEKYDVQIKATPLSDVPSTGKNIIWFSILDSENDLKWRFAVEQ
jgi:hypothetical protein